MTNIVPVGRERHGGKGCRRLTGYAFAATQAVAPLVGSEFANAAVSMPIAFIEQFGRYLPVGIMSPVPGRNLFIDPSGHWLGGYVPAALRSYPFFLVRLEDSDKMILSIDEDCGLVVDADGDTENFFMEDGNPSAALNKVAEFLQQIEQSRQQTESATAALADAQLIQPWPLTITIDNRPLTVNGLHRINEAALNALDDATFLRLRKSSSLVLAYGQLISMQTVGVFAQLAAKQEQLFRSLTPEASSFFAIDHDGTIRFN